MVYTPQEAAEKVGVCRTTILRAIKKGELRALKFGKKIKIEDTDIGAYLEAHVVGDKPQQ